MSSTIFETTLSAIPMSSDLVTSLRQTAVNAKMLSEVTEFAAKIQAITSLPTADHISISMSQNISDQTITRLLERGYVVKYTGKSGKNMNYSVYFK